MCNYVVFGISSFVCVLLGVERWS